MSEFPPGGISIWAAFQTVLGTSDSQPARIIEIYGEPGEHITGDDVVKSGAIYRVEKEVLISPSGSVVTAKEPPSPHSPGLGVTADQFKTRWNAFVAEYVEHT